MGQNASRDQQIVRVQRNDPQVTDLSISNDWSVKQFNSLIGALQLNTFVKRLVFNAITFTASKMQSFTAMLAFNQGIKDLTLSNCSLTGDPLRQLVAELVTNSQLHSLSLSSTGLNDDETPCIVDLVRTNRNLTTLDLSGNNSIGVHGWRAIAGAMRSNTTLVKLGTNKTKIETDSQRIIDDCMDCNKQRAQAQQRAGGIDPWHLRQSASFDRDRTNSTELSSSSPATSLAKQEARIAYLQAAVFQLMEHVQHVHQHMWEEPASRTESPERQQQQVDQQTNSHADLQQAGVSVAGGVPAVSDPVKFRGSGCGYTLTRKLGRGGQGTVWLASRLQDDHAPSSACLVAVKCIPLSYDSQPSRVDEDAHYQELDSPYIVRWIDTIDGDFERFIVLEYCAGGDLRQYLRQQPGRRLSESAAQLIVGYVSLGLQPMHQHPKHLVHRDLKPENLLIHEDGRLLIGDLGLAHFLHDRSVLRSLVGTHPYVAPEVGLRKGQDARGDLYSVGVILFEMLAGRPPTRAELKFSDDQSPSLALPPERQEDEAQAVARQYCDLIDGLLQPTLGDRKEWHQGERLTVEAFLQHPFVQEGRRRAEQGERVPPAPAHAKGAAEAAAAAAAARPPAALEAAAAAAVPSVESRGQCAHEGKLRARSRSANDMLSLI